MRHADTYCNPKPWDIVKAPNLTESVARARAGGSAAALLLWLMIGGRSAADLASERMPLRGVDPNRDASLVVHVFGPDGSAIGRQGMCHVRLADLRIGTTLQPPAHTLAIPFADGGNVPGIGVAEGVYDVWIDVPGFAWFVTTVAIADVHHLSARLEPEGRISVRAGGLHGTLSDTRLRPMRVARPDASHTHFLEMPKRRDSGVWGRLPAGDYQLEAECLSVSPTDETPYAVYRRVQQVTIAPGEEVELTLPIRPDSSAVAYMARGELCIPESWWIGRPDGYRPEVRLFDSGVGYREWRLASVRRRSSDTCGDARTFGWSVDGCPPGRYLMRVDPFNFWDEVQTGGSDANPRVVVGEPSLLGTRLVESRGGTPLVATITDVIPIGRSTQSERFRLAGCRAVANDGTLRVARGQQLRVISRVDGRDVRQQTEVYVDWPEVAIEQTVAPERVVHVRLFVDDQHAPRSVGWWCENAPPRSIGLEDRLLWTAALLKSGDVEYRFACDTQVRMAFGETATVIQPLTPEIARRQVAPTVVELRVAGR